MNKKRKEKMYNKCVNEGSIRKEVFNLKRE